MKFVVGLGNPGLRYARNRHNVGFQIVDAFAAAHGLRFDRFQFKARIADGRLDDQRFLLIKPQNFMNLSGEAVRPLVSFYKIDLADLLVVYDDLDLPLGRLRLRPFGGAGGHNGMRSLIHHLGSDRFPRLRVGIGRPSGSMDPADYVLQDFTPDEEAVMALTRATAVQAIAVWLREGLDAAMNRFNVA